eukprot:gene14258-18880_t
MRATQTPRLHPASSSSASRPHRSLALRLINSAVAIAP